MKTFPGVTVHEPGPASRRAWRYSRAMTTGEPPAQPPQRGLATGRLEALSDGVFAIAITLLVLDIAVPAHASKDLLGAVTHQWPSYLRGQPPGGLDAAVGALALCGARPPGPAGRRGRGGRAADPAPHPGLGGYVLLIVAGLFVPVIAVAGYLAIALFYVIPFRRWTRLDPFGRRRRNQSARS